jgi:MaoC like domain
MIEWFDDLTLGMRFKSGEVSISKEDIKRFATEFDPQPFHLDEAAAEKTVFKGLAASGHADRDCPPSSQSGRLDHRHWVSAELGHSQLQKQATVNGTIPGQAD